MCGATDCPSCGPAQGYRVERDIYGRHYNPDEDDDCGYDRDDPKHPTYADRLDDAADHYREQSKNARLFHSIDPDAEHDRQSARLIDGEL
jgi:hypothetical protein